jgi:hypothetical protein
MAKQNKHLKIRSKIKAPPTKIFIDRKKELNRQRCRGQMLSASFSLLEQELKIATNFKFKIYVKQRRNRTTIIEI